MRQYPFFHLKDPEKRFFVFDMFGTLMANVKGTVDPIFEELCRYYPGVDPKDLVHRYTAMNTEFRRTHRNMEFPLSEVVEGLDREFGFENDPGPMEKPLLRDTGVYGPVEGAENVLSYLRDADYKIGVLSNTRYKGTTLRGMLEDHGLSDFVDEVIASADIGFRKPHAEAYRIMAVRLGAETKQCFFCGDSLSCDYYGPLAAGFRASVLIDPNGVSSVRYRIRSLKDLPDLFERPLMRTSLRKDRSRIEY